jgi:hypothetical protein
MESEAERNKQVEARKRYILSELCGIGYSATDAKMIADLVFDAMDEITGTMMRVTDNAPEGIRTQLLTIICTEMHSISQLGISYALMNNAAYERRVREG